MISSTRLHVVQQTLTVLLTPLLLTATALAADSPAGGEGAQAQPFKTLFDYLKAGGWMEIVILVVSVVAFVAIMDCFLRTRRSVTVPETFLTELRLKLTADGAAPAAAFCAGRNTLIAEVLRVGFRRASEGLQVMESGAYQALEEGLAAFYLRLSVPMGVAVISPLLGLLGTVFSLVAIFGRIMSPSPPTTAEGAHAVMASLIPFATGIVAAVIVLFFYFLLRRRIAKVGVAASLHLREFLEEANQRRQA